MCNATRVRAQGEIRHARTRRKEAARGQMRPEGPLNAALPVGVIASRDCEGMRGMLERDDLEFITARRKRADAPRWGRARRASLAALSLLHLAVLAVLMRTSAEPMPLARPDDVLVVELLPPDPAPPTVPHGPGHRPVAPVREAAGPPKPAREVAPAEAQQPEPGTAATLFNPDGSLRLPRAAEQPDTDTAFHQPEPARLPAPGHPLRYKPTRFDAVWVKDREQLGEKLLRKTTVVKTYDTKGGTRISCVWSPLYALMAFGCGWGPTPREPPKPAPWLAVAGETRPEAERPIDEQPFD